MAISLHEITMTQLEKELEELKGSNAVDILDLQSELEELEMDSEEERRTVSYWKEQMEEKATKLQAALEPKDNMTSLA